MTKEKLVLFLQSGSPITAGPAVAIAEEFSHKIICRNDFLLQAGKVSDDYLFLSAGLMRAFAYDAAGNDVTTGFYTSG